MKGLCAASWKMEMSNNQKKDLERRIYFAEKYKRDKGIEMCVVYDAREKIFQGWPLNPKPRMRIVYRTDEQIIDPEFAEDIEINA